MSTQQGAVGGDKNAVVDFCTGNDMEHAFAAVYATAEKKKQDSSLITSWGSG